MLPDSIAPERLLDMSQPAFAAALAYILTLEGLPILAGICFVFALILLKGTNRAKPAGPILVLALFFTVLAQPLALITAPSLDTLLSPRPQADILRAHQDKGYHATAFYVTSGTYTFYMGGPMDEINDWAELQKRLADHPRIVVATRLHRWKEWQQKAELEPETFRVINTQWIAEREYVILERAASVAPVAPPAEEENPDTQGQAHPAPATPSTAPSETPAATPPDTPSPDSPTPGAATPDPATSEPATPEPATPEPDADPAAPAPPQPDQPDRQPLDDATPKIGSAE
jgi:hypothetical protein